MSIVAVEEKGTRRIKNASSIKDNVTTRIAGEC